MWAARTKLYRADHRMGCFGSPANSLPSQALCLCPAAVCGALAASLPLATAKPRRVCRFLASPTPPACPRSSPPNRITGGGVSGVDIKSCYRNVAPSNLKAQLRIILCYVKMPAARLGGRFLFRNWDAVLPLARCLPGDSLTAVCLPSRCVAPFRLR